MLSKNTLLLLAGAVAGVSLVFSLGSNSGKEGFSPSHQPIPVVDPDHDYLFAGEEIPIEQFDVAERLERELLVNAFYHSSTILAIKMANRYFPEIEKILKEEEVPEDLKYLAVAESGLRPATSSADARGVWQFLKETGIQYGLEVNDEVDERYHLEKSTRAACAYFKALKKRFGSWTLAAAAYNMGGAALSKVMDDQRATTFFELNINDETSRYIFRVVAMKEMLTDPEKYGFSIPKAQLYKPLDDYKEVEVKGPVQSWGDFAKEHKTNYRVLKVYNPWLRDAKLSNKEGKVYEVMVPK
ncbi:MAG: lytic transglycosylase domain-containing protein [Saprospirales bacterium]|nr:lytic transglycosylase domain-containing protein [Saprospirales bacterium]MBK6903197.1 lytic transglycosylase domain-containing protein [Saprospirales bacterium]MBK7334748.1 lytic transglycosylase domain-containing protein [Saprospirales bacterium]